MQKSILIILFACAYAAASPISTEDKPERRLLSYLTDLDDDRLYLDEGEQTLNQLDETKESELQDTNKAVIEVLKQFLEAVLLKADFSEQGLRSLFKALSGLAPPLFGEYAGVVKMLLSPWVARAAASIVKSLQ